MVLNGIPGLLHVGTHAIFEVWSSWPYSFLSFNSYTITLGGDNPFDMWCLGESNTVTMINCYIKLRLGWTCYLLEGSSLQNTLVSIVCFYTTSQTMGPLEQSFEALLQPAFCCCNKHHAQKTALKGKWWFALNLGYSSSMRDIRT